MNMQENKVFINRRKAEQRRTDPDPCAKLPMDLYHRKRRKALDRRTCDRTLEEDYAVFSGLEESIIRH